MNAFTTLISPALPPRLFPKAHHKPPPLGANYVIPDKAKAHPKAKSPTKGKVHRAAARPRAKAHPKEKAPRAKAPPRAKQHHKEKVPRPKAPPEENAPRKAKAFGRTDIYIPSPFRDC